MLSDAITDTREAVTGLMVDNLATALGVSLILGDAVYKVALRGALRRAMGVSA